MILSFSEQTAIKLAQNFWEVMFKERLAMAKLILLIKEGQGQVWAQAKCPDSRHPANCHYTSFDLKGQDSAEQSWWVTQQLGGCSAFIINK